jgi:hypothetical protein
VRKLLPVALALVAVMSVVAQSEDSALSESDRDFLIEVSRLTVSPKGECIQFTRLDYSVWGGGFEAKQFGWLERDEEGNPLRVSDIDGDWKVVPKEFEVVDFLALADEYFTGKAIDDHFPGGIRQSPGAMNRLPRPVAAAWCRALGDSSLAELILRGAHRPDSNEEALKRVRRDLAWRSYSGAVHAFMYGDDKQALHFAQRFADKYAEEFDSEFGTPGSRVLADLLRRKEAGTFGKYQPTEHDDDWNLIPNMPEDFEGWDAEKKLNWLIADLENLDARQMGQPGGVNLERDWRVAELVKLGEMAVPALIDTLESDTRLTRSVHFWRDFATYRTVFGVREPAVSAVMTILQVRVFEPRATGDSLSARGDERAKQIATRLREYWDKYGQYPFDERMMKILTDEKANFDARIEAAMNLAYINDRSHIGTTVWTTRRKRGDAEPNPAVEKFEDPTVAEAIVALMDSHLAAETDTDKWRRVLNSYVNALVQLGDERVIPLLNQRIEGASEAAYARALAWGCLWLGDADAFTAFCKRFAEGTEPGLDDADTLLGMIDMLVRAEIPAAEAALDALISPEHPAYTLYRDSLLQGRPGSYDARSLFRSRHSILLLFRELGNTEATGTTYSMSEGNLVTSRPRSQLTVRAPEFLTDVPEGASAEERHCDKAAALLVELVAGLPRYHPLMNDAEQRLDDIRELMGRYINNLRRASADECRALGISSFIPFYVFYPEPLDRPATEDDVAAGNAAFHLQEGTLADMTLPAKAALEPADPAGERRRAIIFQAEVDADGNTWYAILERHQVRRVAAEDVHDIAPLTR